MPADYATKNKIRTFFKSTSQIKTPLGILRVGEQLGEGGNALVFTANWGRDVAVKFLAEDCSVKESTRYKRFITEFRELAQLANTGVVVSIHYFGALEIEQSKFPYIVMERCPFTLKKWAEENPIKVIDALLPIFRRLIHSRV